jgi:glutamine synthetase
VFDEKDMQQRIPGSVFNRWKASVTEGKPLDADTADVIATALKDWALERGVTHYSHWFQPWTSGPAEKHDGFLAPHISGLNMLFSGKALVNGETDGSSFPSGGLRVTHEARGYTVWDSASSPFIYNLNNQDPTLFIPSLFYSWKGDALDRKIPLLRSTEALKKQTLKLFAACELRQHKAVHTDSGIEQEFFLLDANHVRQRPDIALCGRTLQGRHPPKGQELSDSYFGPMTAKTLQVIHEMEQRCWELGVPITTRHREVCPNQYEMAPIFEKAAIACDHNLILMNVMDHVARQHGLVASVHEKPFAHVNGSGKHNNWSIGTDVKGTLFGPGQTPDQNIEFLLAVAGVIRGAEQHADLLRVSRTRKISCLRCFHSDYPNSGAFLVPETTIASVATRHHQRLFQFMREQSCRPLSKPLLLGLPGASPRIASSTWEFHIWQHYEPTPLIAIVHPHLPSLETSLRCARWDRRNIQLRVTRCSTQCWQIRFASWRPKCAARPPRVLLRAMRQWRW